MWNAVRNLSLNSRRNLVWESSRHHENAIQTSADSHRDRYLAPLIVSLWVIWVRLPDTSSHKVKLTPLTTSDSDAPDVAHGASSLGPGVLELGSAQSVPFRVSAKAYRDEPPNAEGLFEFLIP